MGTRTKKQTITNLMIGRAKKNEKIRRTLQ
uniref:Uncharacterized protein n=1 Tax=Siphoviridae sp. ct6HQ3 TaxID=2825341 RepID=A0A8S5VA95_9CAUD|nr:MAG TPA: hypothetical protein [Siphoviridae sp. ct6HQ3]